MATVIVHFKAQDYGKWFGVFGGRTEVRTSAGATSEHIYKDSNDPNLVTLVFTWNSLENARKFFSSPVLRAALKESGVIGEPTFHYLVDA